MGLTYDVVIRRVADGAERTCPSGFEWRLDEDGQPDLFWWEDGNGACDCNRAILFAKAGGEVDDAADCGSEAYELVRYVLADGTVIASGEVPDLVCLDAVRGPHDKQACAGCGVSTVGVIETRIDSAGNRWCGRHQNRR